MYVSVRFPKYLALCFGFMVGVVCVRPAHAPVANPPGLQLLDEGTTQGQTVFLDCVGDGIACSVSGTTGTVSVGAGPGSGDITAVGDDTTGAAFTATAGDDGSTLWFEGSTVDGNEVAVTTADPASDVTITIPAATDTLVGRATTDTLTNKTIDATNTVTINASDITDLNAATDITADLEEEGVTCTDCISPADLGAADFGDFTCSAGDTCTLDTGTVSDNEIDYTNVTCADLTMSDCDEDFTTSSTTPSYNLQDSDALDGDISAAFDVNCTDVGSGTEDCDLTISLKQGGVLISRLFIDGDTQTFRVGSSDLVVSNPTPSVRFLDVDASAGDTNGRINVGCTDVGDGTEDCDLTLGVQENGAAIDFRLSIDADGDVTLGSADSQGINLDAGTGTVNLDTSGGATLTQTATECVMLDAAGITCLGTNGCTDPADIDGTNFSFKTAAFATGADDLGSWVFELPDNLSGTIASVTFIWFSDNAACNNGADDDVCWTIDGGSFADDAAFETGALGGTEKGVTDRCTADGDIMRTAAITFTHGMTAGQTAAVLVRRDTDETIADCAAGTDDYAQDAKLRAVKFCYEVDNVFSGE